MTIARRVPGMAALKACKAAFLPHDLAAGVTLGAVLVPVGLANGELAGLPMAGGKVVVDLIVTAPCPLDLNNTLTIACSSPF